jgi:non-ribosomal peptide synthetase component F
MFINAVPVRVQVDAGRRLHGWLQEVQERQARARAHEHAPLTAVHGWSEVPRSQPLFETLLVFESYPVTSSWREGGSGRLRVRGARSLTRTNYPLTILIVPGERWSIRAMYASDRVDEGSARRILRLLATLLERIAEGEDLPLHALSPMEADERRRVLVEWNDTGDPAAPPTSVHALVAEQAARTPDAPALEWEGGSLAYRELEERTNRLARRLRAAGVGPESRVGVMLERGEELPVALLAILKAGGAYVPLDPEYPAERLAFMRRDAGASVLLTHAALRERVAAPRVLVLIPRRSGPPWRRNRRMRWRRARGRRAWRTSSTPRAPRARPRV